jgi:hypothetical protein
MAILFLALKYLLGCVLLWLILKVLMKVTKWFP